MTMTKKDRQQAAQQLKTDWGNALNRCLPGDHTHFETPRTSSLDRVNEIREEARVRRLRRRTRNIVHAPVQK